MNFLEFLILPCNYATIIVGAKIACEKLRKAVENFCQLYHSFTSFEFNYSAFFLKGYYWKGMTHFANERYIESSECFITALNLTSDDNLKYRIMMKLLHGRVKSGNYY